MPTRDQTKPDKSGHSVRTEPERWLTLAEAAAIEGTTTEALRKRIKRGLLDAKKDGGRWCVKPGTVSRHVQTEPDSAPSSTWNSETVAALREVIDTQRQHVKTLTEQLEAKDSELRAMHVHIERLTRALPPPEDQRAEPERKTKRPRWWPF